MNIRYGNHYGTLELEPGAYQPIRAIHSRLVAGDAFITIDQAERVALITGNRRIQMAKEPGTMRMYIVHHTAPDVGAVCRLVHLDFDASVDARRVIEAGLVG